MSFGPEFSNKRDSFKKELDTTKFDRVQPPNSLMSTKDISRASSKEIITQKVFHSKPLDKIMKSS